MNTNDLRWSDRPYDIIFLSYNEITMWCRCWWFKISNGNVLTILNWFVYCFRNQIYLKIKINFSYDFYLIMISVGINLVLNHHLIYNHLSELDPASCLPRLGSPIRLDYPILLFLHRP